VRRPGLSPEVRHRLYAHPVPAIHESEIIKDVLIVNPDRHGDERGVFIETYRRSWFPLGREMVQANRGERKAGAVVGKVRKRTGPRFLWT
jgi:dTDP-4-dehydrorhamnose 3,5-epimerase-like enzyme